MSILTRLGEHYLKQLIQKIEEIQTIIDIVTRQLARIRGQLTKEKEARK